MSIRAECNRCLEEYRVKDEFAGEVIRCKACGASFRVPHEDGFDEVVGRRPCRSRQSGRQGRRRGKTRRNVISEAAWLVGVAVFVAACAIGGGVPVAVNQMRGVPDVPGVAETEPATSCFVGIWNRRALLTGDLRSRRWDGQETDPQLVEAECRG